MHRAKRRRQSNELISVASSQWVLYSGKVHQSQKGIGCAELTQLFQFVTGLGLKFYCTYKTHEVFCISAWSKGRKVIEGLEVTWRCCLRSLCKGRLRVWHKIWNSQWQNAGDLCIDPLSLKFWEESGIEPWRKRRYWQDHKSGNTQCLACLEAWKQGRKDKHSGTSNLNKFTVLYRPALRKGSVWGQGESKTFDKNVYEEKKSTVILSFFILLSRKEEFHVQEVPENLSFSPLLLISLQLAASDRLISESSSF